MAFPSVSSTNSSTQVATTTHTVSLPASIVAGNLLVVFFENEDDTVVSTPAGWSLLKSLLEASGATNKLTVFYKTASGAEGATLSVTTSTSRVSSHASYQITGFSGTPEVSTGATGTTGSPDPDSLTPSGGAKDYLWIAVGGSRNNTFTAYPANYSGSQLTRTITGALGGCSIGVATRNLNATSEDPGTFTATSNFWVACTIAISPVNSSGNFLSLLGVGA